AGRPEALKAARPAEVATAADWTQGHGKGAAVVLCLAWAVGSVVGLLRLLRGLCKQCRAIPGKTWQPEFWTEADQTRLARVVGLRKFPELWLSPAVPMPMVVGFQRPRIVLPEAFVGSWSQAQWEAILLHEAAHVARRDQWAVLAQRLAGVLYWWCPLVHLLNRRLDHLRENICDDYALQGTCDGVPYAELLIETAEHLLDRRTATVTLGLVDSAQSGLEARVLRVLDKERRPMTVLAWPGKLLIAVVVAATCLLTVGVTAFAQSPPPPPKIEIRIIVDG